MNVRVAERLARLPAGAVRNARALLVRLGPVPQHARLDAGRLGDLDLELVGVRLPGGTRMGKGDGRGTPVEAQRYQLAGSSGRAWIAVEAHLASRLAARLLGMPAPRVERTLGAGERGALAAFVVSVLRAAGSALCLSLPADACDAVETAAAVGLRYRARVGGEHGLVDFWLTPEFVPERRLCGDAKRAASLPLPLAIELATTRVPAGELATAQAGDAVVFDGVPAVAGGVPLVDVEPSAWRVTLRVGGWRAAGSLAADGRLTIESEFATDGAPEPGAAGEEDHDTMDSDDSTRPGHVHELLAAAPVEVVAELGRLTLRGEEVLGLVPGSVLTLPAAHPADIELRVGGRLWARGELVDVDGELAVRIISVP